MGEERGVVFIFIAANMKIIDKTILTKLKKPLPNSHKGQNGRILIIAGSKKYHGALLLTVQAASRIVDMVYVHSSDNNMKLINKLRSEIAAFIAIGKKELWDTIALVDSIIIGPGMPETGDTVGLVHDILHKHPEKKIVVDATALWHVKPSCLHKNSIVTPHSREFINVFGVEATARNVRDMAEKYGCVVVLKGAVDYISDGHELYANKTGNVGMTKGGTGDVLAGIIGALSATNDILVSALAGAYLNGLLGDRLYKKAGVFYNAEDLIGESGKLWKEM